MQRQSIRKWYRTRLVVGRASSWNKFEAKGDRNTPADHLGHSMHVQTSWSYLYRHLLAFAAATEV